MLVSRNLKYHMAASEILICSRKFNNQRQLVICFVSLKATYSYQQGTKLLLVLVPSYNCLDIYLCLGTT
jgi:hypothetical protein